MRREKIKKDEEKHQQLIEYARRRRDPKMNALKREDQQSNVSETGDLRECLYIVNFDTTIETDTFLWRSLRLIWCSCQGAKRGAAGD